MSSYQGSKCREDHINDPVWMRPQKEPLLEWRTILTLKLTGQKDHLTFFLLWSITTQMYNEQSPQTESHAMLKSIIFSSVIRHMKKKCHVQHTICITSKWNTSYTIFQTDVIFLMLTETVRAVEPPHHEQSFVSHIYIP